MPGKMLHDGATVTCTPGKGIAKPVTTNPYVKISGQAVVTHEDSYLIIGCQGGPCRTAPTPLWINAAIYVRAGGSPVILSTSQALCDVPAHSLKIDITQQFVQAV